MLPTFFLFGLNLLKICAVGCEELQVQSYVNSKRSIVCWNDS